MGAPRRNTGCHSITGSKRTGREFGRKVEPGKVKYSEVSMPVE
jgi:hypothetical protein